MGYMRHHAILVTGSDEWIKEAHRKAKALGNACTPISKAQVNDIQTFVVVPDGSKEGWPESDLGDTARTNFINWLYEQRNQRDYWPLDWAEVVYGDDEGELSVRGSSR